MFRAPRRCRLADLRSIQVVFRMICSGSNRGWGSDVPCAPPSRNLGYPETTGAVRAGIARSRVPAPLNREPSANCSSCPGTRDPLDSTVGEKSPLIHPDGQRAVDVLAEGHVRESAACKSPCPARLSTSTHFFRGPRRRFGTMLRGGAVGPGSITFRRCMSYTIPGVSSE